jgi:hypothetical protein
MPTVADLSGARRRCGCPGKEVLVVPLSDALESRFLFPMVAVAQGGEGGSGGVGCVGNGRNDVGRLLKVGSAWNTMPLVAPQKPSAARHSCCRRGWRRLRRRSEDR